MLNTNKIDNSNNNISIIKNISQNDINQIFDNLNFKDNHNSDFVFDIESKNTLINFDWNNETPDLETMDNSDIHKSISDNKLFKQLFVTELIDDEDTNFYDDNNENFYMDNCDSSDDEIIYKNDTNENNDTNKNNLLKSIYIKNLGNVSYKTKSGKIIIAKIDDQDGVSILHTEIDNITNIKQIEKYKSTVSWENMLRKKYDI